MYDMANEENDTSVNKCNFLSEIDIERVVSESKQTDEQRAWTQKKLSVLEARKWGTLPHKQRWSGVDSSSTVRSYWVESERTVVRYQEQSSGQQCCVWDCSLALTHFLELHSHLVKQKTVLELGCGLGLPGIVAFALGAYKVWLTDMEQAMPIVQQQLVLNNHLFSKGGSILPVKLHWGRDSAVEFIRAAQADTVDVVLLSDTIYAGDRVTNEKLVETLSIIKAPLIINCYELRNFEDENAEYVNSRLSSFGYHVSKVSKPEINPGFADELIQIYVYELRSTP